MLCVCVYVCYCHSSCDAHSHRRVYIYTYKKGHNRDAHQLPCEKRRPLIILLNRPRGAYCNAPLAPRACDVSLSRARTNIYLSSCAFPHCRFIAQKTCARVYNILHLTRSQFFFFFQTYNIIRFFGCSMYI